MKPIIRPAALSAAVLTLALLTAPGAYAQSSTHSKTVPGDQQAVEQEPTEQEAAAPEPAGEAQSGATQNVAAEAAPEDQPESANIATEGEQSPGDQAAAPQDGNALGVSGGWDTKFNTAPPQTSQYTGAPEQVEIVEQVNAYFNDIKNLEGLFLQTDANDESKKGRFYIERPGKVLFDYAPPSMMKIVSNGEYLAIENHVLETTDRYPLESTPFKLLLKDDVNLAKDSNIVAVDQGENIVVLTVEDKEGGGQIRLFFEWPELKLREWIITDAQGLNTRIQLAELETNKEVDDKLFTFSKGLGLPDFKN